MKKAGGTIRLFYFLRSKSRALSTSTPKAAASFGRNSRLGLADDQGKGDIAFEEAFNDRCHSHGFDYLVDGDPVVRVSAVAMPHIREEFDRRYTIRESGEDRETDAIRAAFSRTRLMNIGRRQNFTTTQNG